MHSLAEPPMPLASPKASCEHTLVKSTSFCVPDLEWAKRRVPIHQVVDALKLERLGHMVRCWRPGNHQYQDRTPSVGIHFKRNRVKCFVCDARALSVVDLVQSVLGQGTYEALQWLAARFEIPTLPKGKHLVKRSQHDNMRVGVSGHPLEGLIRSGLYAELGAPEIRLLDVLTTFTDTHAGLAILSYAALRRFSGLKKDDTVSNAIKRLANMHIIEVIKGRAGDGLSACNRYRITLEDARLVALMAECRDATRREIEAERTLRARRRASLSSERKLVHKTG